MLTNGILKWLRLFYLCYFIHGILKWLRLFMRSAFNTQFWWVIKMHYMDRQHALTRWALWTGEVSDSWVSVSSLPIFSHMWIRINGHSFIIMACWCFTLKTLGNILGDYFLTLLTICRQLVSMIIFTLAFVSPVVRWLIVVDLFSH